MSSTRSFASEKERRLNEALAQYLEAEEAGQSPDQAALLARYPDLVSDLNEFFANRAGLASLARPFRGVAADATAAFVSPPPAGGVAGLAAGRRFGDYEILEEIARGGMGIVYRARQLSLRREVALKMILAGPTASPATLRRFRIEAEAAAHLDHPHIVPIYDVGEIDGQAYFTMKLVEAGCLASRLDEFRLPLPGAGPRPGRRVLEQEQARLAGLLATVARAVHHAHLRGILHRDLKPANILLDGDGNPLLSDFGLAKRFEQDGQLTGAQTVIGTAAYMAPEQARPGKDGLTTAADVYALGAILYELLTGRPPHVGASFFETLLKVVEEQPVPPRQRNPHAAPDLNAICLKCLAKEAGQRYGSAQELAEDLERCRAGKAISLRRQNPAERAWRWARRNRLAAALLAAVAVLVAVISVGSPIAAWNIAVSRDQADRNAREAEEHARKERAARTAAEQARNLAMTALGAEQRAQAQNHRLLVSGYVANGTRSLDGGDPFGALVWYGEALNLDAGDADREDPHRVRLAAVLRRCPKLVQVWFDNDEVPPAFSPDGRRVLLVQDNRAQVWDVAGGQAVSAPVRHRSKIERATFSPDGSRVLTASADGTARIWDAHTGDADLQPLEHGKAVTYAAFSSDGSRVVTVGADRAARVWNARTGRLVAGPLRHPLPVLFASFSRDGKHLVTCGGDPDVHDVHKGAISIWEIPPGKAAPRIISTVVVMHWACLTDATHVLGAGGRHMLRRWELSAASPDKPIGDPVFGVRLGWDGGLSPDAGRVLKLDGSTAQVYDVASGRPAGPLLLHGGETLLAAFSPDGKWVVTAARDRTVRVWDAGTGQPVSPPLRHARPVHHAAFSADGRLLMTSADDGGVRVWELGSRELVRPLVHLGGGAAAVSPDGRLVARVDREGAVRVSDAVSGQALQGPWKLDGAVTQLAFAPDGRRLLLASEESARVWDAVVGQPVTPVLNHAGGVQQVLFTPDGSRVAILDANDLLQVYSIATGARQSAQPLPPHAIWRGWSLSPDGRAVVLARTAQILEVRDVVSGAPRGDLFKHTAVVSYPVFSPDGSRLSAASADGSACVWNVSTGHLAVPPLQHGQPLRQVAFSGDGRRLVTVAEDRTVRVWDVLTGQPVTPLLRHGEPVVRASLGSDGRRLVALGKSGAGSVWDLSPDDRPEADLRGLTQVLSGQKLDSGSGGFEPLETSRMRASWPRLRARYPQEFTLSAR